MNRNVLMDGYHHIVSTIYSPRHYYERIMNFLKEYRPVKSVMPRFSLNELAALLKANFRLGLIGRERWYYWRLFFWSVFRKPRVFPLAITLSIYGYHFRKVFGD